MQRSLAGRCQLFKYHFYEKDNRTITAADQHFYSSVLPER
jgi:hypothetical protein